ncbi:hypothetical protein H0W80_02855 [Candidatus Saccharibacteria bacterium]|nr:hypothetical protein [Candidatus Saccharibacteria bacterium]
MSKNGASDKTTQTQTRRFTVRRVLIVIGVLVIIVIICFVGYFVYSASHSLPANQKAFALATRHDQTQFTETSSYYLISPVRQTTTGIIIYPGAFTDPKAYVGQYSELAEMGTAVFVIKSPFNFALFEVNRADRIMSENTAITRWYTAGHSLGGVAACDFAKSHQAKLSGLILLASYCNGSAKNLTIPVLSISGTQDGLATPQKIEASKKDLPANTTFYVIGGANHTFFGSFARMQPGDNPATIDEQDARTQIINTTYLFMMPQ